MSGDATAARAGEISPSARRNGSCEGARRNATRWAGAARLQAQGVLFAACDALALVGAAVVVPLVAAPGRSLATVAEDWNAGQWMTLHPGGQTVRSVAVMLVVLGFFAKREHYTARLPGGALARDILGATVVALLCEELLLLTAANPQTGPWAPVLRWSITLALLLVGRALGRRLLRRTGAWRLDTVLVASGEATTRVVKALSREAGLGYRVVGTIDVAAPNLQAALQARGEVATAAIEDMVASHGGSFLAIATAATGDEVTTRLAAAARHARIPAALVRVDGAASVMERAGHCFPTHDIAISTLHPKLSRLLAAKAKLLLDFTAAACLLALSAPLMLAIAWQVRRDGGPALFRHQRIGANGRIFPCMKFRTMRTDADAALAEILARDPSAAAEWSATQKLRDDPRITPIGQVLRRTSLDELPQLFNVLRGEMSLVGPRPIVASEVRFYGKHIADYYEARPGITGLWQVSGRSDTSYPRRVQLDVWYVRNWMLWHDIAILLKTVPVVLFRRGAV